MNEVVQTESGNPGRISGCLELLESSQLFRIREVQKEAEPKGDPRRQNPPLDTGISGGNTE